MKQPYTVTKGFTLVELMITVAILGVIAGIAIPAYNGYIETARMTEADNNLAAIRLAEEEYFLEKNTYFAGKTSDSTLSNASDGLWTVAKGSDNNVNFDYEVTLSTPPAPGWTATAKGKTGTKVAGKTRTITK